MPEGGTEPLWSPSEREIFYRNGQKMMVAAVQTRPTFTVRERRELFEGTYADFGVYRNYDVTGDGRSFVMIRPLSTTQDLIVVLNWFAQLGGGLARAASAVR